MLTYADAVAEILKLPVAPLPERIPLLDAAGRYLASETRAPWSLPTFDQSAMDGFAVYAEDLWRAAPSAEVRLRILGESAAGLPFTGDVPRGGAVRISTGAQVPSGMNAVVPIEISRVVEDEVGFAIPPRAEQFVRRAGTDVKEGEIIGAKGARITPGLTALLAFYNLVEVDVVVKPRVGILTSGDELRALGADLGPTQIVASSVYLLNQALEEFGAEARLFGIAPDHEDGFARLFREALAWSDVVVTTAGVSVGEHDVVGRVVEREGGSVNFWRVAVRPGKPMLVATFGEKTHFGFPGNPVSTACNLEVFLKPHLRRWFGVEPAVPPLEKVRLGAPCPRDRQRLFFVYAEIRVEAGERVLHPIPNQNSGNQLLPAKGHALAVVEAGAKDLAAGELVEVVVLS